MYIVKSELCFGNLFSLGCRRGFCKVQCEFNKFIQTSEFEAVWSDIRKNKDENRIKRENRNPKKSKGTT